LGGWTSSANASGAPELSPLASADEFTADNSAILEDSLSQIFCGQFEGDAPLETTPDTVALNISWVFKTVAGPPGVTESRPEAPVEITPEPAPDALPADIEATPAPDGGAGSSGDIAPIDPSADQPSEVAPEAQPEPPVSDPESTPVSEPAPEPAPETTPEPTPAPEPTPEPEPAPVPESQPEPAPAAESSPAAWLFHLVRLAFAQEVPVSENINAEQPVAEEAPAQESILPEETTEASGAESETSTEAGAVESGIPVEEPVVSEDVTVDAEDAPADAEDITAIETDPQQKNLLDVRYSTDGENWKSLGTIGESNWQEVQLAVPITSWEELKVLQISVVSLPVSDIEPVVYLDGMSLTVNYTSLPPDPYPAPDTARGDIFLSHVTYETNTVALVARPVPGQSPASESTETATTTEAVTTTEAATTTEAVTTTEQEVFGDIPTADAPAADEPPQDEIELATTTENIVVPEATSTTLSFPPVPPGVDTSSMIKELWVRDDISMGWTRVAGQELLAEDPNIHFEYGNIFWLGPEGKTIWRFNPSSKSYDSVSVSEGEVPTLRFGDEASGQQELIFDQDEPQPIRFEEVKIETDAIQ
jgi:hypothetical protein